MERPDIYEYFAEKLGCFVSDLRMGSHVDWEDSLRSGYAFFTGGMAGLYPICLQRCAVGIQRRGGKGVFDQPEVSF